MFHDHRRLVKFERWFRVLSIVILVGGILYAAFLAFNLYMLFGDPARTGLTEEIMPFWYTWVLSFSLNQILLIGFVMVSSFGLSKLIRFLLDYKARILGSAETEG